MQPIQSQTPQQQIYYLQPAQEAQKPQLTVEQQQQQPMFAVLPTPRQQISFISTPSSLMRKRIESPSIDSKKKPFVHHYVDKE